MSDALKKLIEAVEAGSFLMDVLPPRQEIMAYEAFSGRLDAAKALHDSLLHEAAWASISHSNRYEGESTAEVTLAGGTWQARSDNPARAWLLAILKAKLQEDRG